MRIRKKMLAALSGAVVAGTALAAISSTGLGPASADPSHNAKLTLTADAGRLDPVARAAFGPGTGRLVVDWNKELVTLEQTPGAQPPTIHPTRSYALLQTAIYDAVVSITHADAPYAFSVVAPRNARPDAAADQAAHDTLVALFPSFAPQLNQMLGTELATIPDGPAKDAGLIAGGHTATIILALRAGDGSAVTPPPFVAGTQPGDYQLTPPNLAAAAFTTWGNVTPWVLSSGHQFRPPAPPALTSPQWAAAINEVQSLGEDSSTTRTADETMIAEFWAPPIWNTWNEITEGQVVSRNSDLEQAAHVFADLNLTLADSAISFYDAKYTYQLWRPVTAIRTGTPNNPAVDPANPTWLPQPTNTAPDPSYPAAHSTISSAAATVLTAIFGNHVKLTVTSDALPGVTRNFNSFEAAAQEAGLSRIFAGQHTRIDVNAGNTLGRHVAEAVLDQPFGIG